MPSKSVRLDTAEFLDSPEAAGLAGVPQDARRRLAEAFFSASHDGLKTAPEKLDGEGVRTLVTTALPGQLRAADPVAEHADEVLDALLRFLETSRVFPQVFEARLALEDSLATFQEVVRGGTAAGQGAAPVDPFVHGAPKLGRNDPCSCGSGKKFKKCHGRGQ